MNNSWRIDTINELTLTYPTEVPNHKNLRLAFEVLHYIQEFVVYIRLLVKLFVNLIQVAQGILTIRASVPILQKPTGFSQMVLTFTVIVDFGGSRGI